MSARTLVALALTTAFPSFTRAADLHPALARAKQATGGARWDPVQTTYTRAKLKIGGLEGVVEDWGDVQRGRYAHRYTLGPAKGGEGYDGTKVWTQDDSGQVRAEESTDAREGAADQAYRTALAYWFPERWPASIEDGGERREGDRRFTIVRITPRGGRPFDLWIDVATGLIDRWAEKDATRVRTIFLSDYREVAGVRVPFAIRQTTGDPKYDAFFTLERVSFDEPLDDARFAPPPPPPPDFALAGGATSATVPFQLVNNHIYVDVRLNGKGPFRLLCDTGGSNFVTPEVAKELGVEAQGALEVRGAGEKSEDVALTRIGMVELGGASVRDQLFLVLPFTELSAVEGLSVQGLVGYEIFKRFVVTIDYPRRTLTLHAPGTFREDGRGVAVPFRFAEHIPEVDGALDGIPGTFWIDTGSRASLSIESAFAEKHGLARRYGARVKAVTGWGIGGAARGLLARAQRLTLGEAVAIDRPVMDISIHDKGGPANRYLAGNVGGAILKRFVVTFDYEKQRVVFAPGASTAPEPYDRSGLWLNLGKGGFEVMDVVPDGPGAKAGIRVGDRVVAVDGKPASKMSLAELRERLRTEPVGTRVKLSVESGGKRRDATLVLADLV
jgi:PDZ domain/Aspartyl protease